MVGGICQAPHKLSPDLLSRIPNNPRSYVLAAGKKKRVLYVLVSVCGLDKRDGTMEGACHNTPPIVAL